MKDKGNIEVAIMQRDIVYIRESVGAIKNEIMEIRKEIDESRQEFESKYVTQIEFAPVQKIIYGMVGIVLVEVLGIILFVTLNYRQ